MVLPAQHLTALVQFAHTHTHVVQLRIVGHIDNLLLTQRDTIHLTEGRQETDDDRRTRRQAADGQRTLDDTTEAHAQLTLLGQCPRGAPQVVSPVVLLLRRHRGDMPLCAFGKLQRSHLHHPVLLGGVCYMDALVDGEARYFT